MVEYKGVVKEGVWVMVLMKKREKMKVDIEVVKNKIFEVCFLLCEFGFFVVNFVLMIVFLLLNVCCCILFFVEL